VRFHGAESALYYGVNSSAPVLTSTQTSAAVLLTSHAKNGTSLKDSPGQGSSFASLLKQLRTADIKAAKPSGTTTLSVGSTDDNGAMLAAGPNSVPISAAADSSNAPAVAIESPNPNVALKMIANASSITAGVTNTAVGKTASPASKSDLGTDKKTAVKMLGADGKRKGAAHGRTGGASLEAPGNADSANSGMVPAQQIALNPVAQSTTQPAIDQAGRGKPTTTTSTPLVSVSLGASTKNTDATGINADRVLAASASAVHDPARPVTSDNSDEDGADSHRSLLGEAVGTATALQQSHAVSVEEPTGLSGATFHPSLAHTVQAPHEGSGVTTDAVAQASTAADDANPIAKPLAVGHHLEIAVNDPMMGNIGVRAEMRSGALHAVISGAGATATATLPELRQFLQQHDVALKSLSFVSAPANDVGPQMASAVTSSFGGAMDSSSSNPSSAQQQQQDANRTVTHWDSLSPVPSDDTARATSGAQALIQDVVPSGSTLSIHI
jgi:hypothetical protein